MASVAWPPLRLPYYAPSASSRHRPHLMNWMMATMKAPRQMEPMWYTTLQGTGEGRCMSMSGAASAGRPRSELRERRRAPSNVPALRRRRVTTVWYYGTHVFLSAASTGKVGMARLSPLAQ